MKKIFILSLIVMIFSIYANAQKSSTIWPMNGLIRVYFMQPPDYTFANNGNDAVQLSNCVFDTLAAYINRAKYTVDIAQYEYKTYTGDPIYTAINNAYLRGVKIRYIQDYGESSGNTGVKDLNPSIPVLTSPNPNTTPPCGGSYNISHNKFVVIDEYSPDTTNAIVWTGSLDWDVEMNTGDYNNNIIFQSKELAKAFTHEFDIMWGDTTHGGAANDTTSLFGPCKPNSGQHIFNIGGSEVELYFSPSDGVNNEIISNITSATNDLYCGMFTFTEDPDADSIVAHKTKGAFAAAILDQYSSGSDYPYTTILPNGLGSNFVGYVNNSYVYHNKYLIVNPTAPCEDPKVLTGSHNWTSSANYSNDENTVIVHNDTVANFYLQAFAGDFKAIKGTSLAHATNQCAFGINNINLADDDIYLFPNPAIEGSPVYLNINPSLNLTNAKLVIYDLLGNKLNEITSVTRQNSTIDYGIQTKGIYFYQFFNNGKLIKVGKLLVE
jgi:phosphatidylserine/phosphatidylglycerophosphate/cardiolipin synthase-like enzyme